MRIVSPMGVLIAVGVLVASAASAEEATSASFECRSTLSSTAAVTIQCSVVNGVIHEARVPARRGLC